MISNKKRFIIPILSLVLLGIMFNFIAAPLALAAQTPTPTPTPAPAPTPGQTADTKNILGTAGGAIWNAASSALLWGLNVVLTGTGIFLARLVVIVAFFFNYMIYFNLYKFADMVGTIKVGWDISRNVANIFFILILLIISIATILRIQSYNAKQLLPKLIMVALLINFSLTMGLVVIDASNVLGKNFYDSLTKNGDIAASIMQGTAFNSIFNIVEASKDSNNITSWVLPGILGGAVGGCAAGLPAAGIGCIGTGLIGAGAGLVGGLASWWKWGATKDFADAASYFYPITIVNVVSVIIIFVFIFGGILLAIRVAILALLLVLAPIAFLFYILPTTEKHWNTWWEKFLAHAFFLPAFMFMLYISILFSNSIALAATQGGIANPGFFIGLFLIVIMLISSLLLARTMGVYFAGSVLSWATSSRKWLTGFVGGVAGRNLVSPLGERLKPAAARITQASPWLGTYARGAQEWLAKRGGARDIAEDQAKAALALAKPTWADSFRKGTLPMREAMLKNLPEKQRGEFLAKLPSELLQSAEDIINSPRFSGAEQKDLAKSRMQFEMNQAQLQGNLGGFMAGKSDEERQNYFGAMSENQKTALLGEWYGNTATLDKFVRLATAEPKDGGLSLEDQEKFKQSLKSASGPAVSAYVNQLTGDAREKTLKALSPSQLAYLYTNTSDETKRKAFDNISNTLAPDVQQQYNDAAAKILNQKSSADLITAIPSLSDNMTGALIRSRGVDGTIDLINDAATPEPVKRKLLGSIKTTGLSSQYAKKLDPVTKVKYLDYPDPAETDKDPVKFTEAVAVEVKNSTARELAQRTSAKILRDKNFKESLLKGGSIMQLAALTDTPEKSSALKEILSEAVDKDFSADNLAKKLKDKFNNEILGQQLSNLRRRQKEMMSQPERLLYSQIFGDL